MRLFTSLPNTHPASTAVVSIPACVLATLAALATIVLGPASPSSAAAGFGDVPANMYYSQPVQWMADGEITTGTSPGCFSPDRSVTRAEVAVFLWRYDGEPNGGSEPFSDVAAGRSYSEAVAWMVGAAITTGTTPTTFDPDRSITRAEAATFIWRYAGSPAGGSEPFNDVAAGRFYSEAVAWMVGAAITTGTSPTTFHPDRSVTRAEIATFLWRFDGSEDVAVDAGGTCGGSGGSPDRFETVGVGAALPSGAECAQQVRPAAEIRPGNATQNATRGSGPHPDYTRVDGDFVGTTDEILQWAACKWGIDEDLVRAQAVKESWWHMSAGGDVTYDSSRCHWSVSSQTPCPESLGILQVRQHYHSAAMDDAVASTAYNADYTYAVWRSCYEGELTWLNDVERGATYGAGDVWGCLGVWFSGRWYTGDATWYMDGLGSILSDRTWETTVFINATSPG